MKTLMTILIICLLACMGMMADLHFQLKDLDRDIRTQQANDSITRELILQRLY